MADQAEQEAELIYGIIKPKCLDLLKIIDIAEFAQGECLKDTMSKLLGFLIVILAPLAKVPQIINILLAGSAEGISTMAYLMESTSYVIFFVYNYRNGFPFSTYGESLFIYIQNLLILLLIAVYRGLSSLQSLLLIALVGSMLVMMSDSMVSLEVLAAIQGLQILMNAISKLTQIYENIKNGSTGQLSSITVFLFFVGSLARVFTTLQDAPDPILIVSVGIAGFLNSILFLQVVIYSGARKKEEVCCKSGDKGKKDD